MNMEEVGERESAGEEAVFDPAFDVPGIISNQVLAASELLNAYPDFVFTYPPEESPCGCVTFHGRRSKTNRTMTYVSRCESFASETHKKATVFYAE